MKIYLKALVFCLSTLFFSCDDIIEEDLSNDIVQTVYPTEGTVIESNVVTFSWNELDGADDYRVQVYDLNQVKVHDTLVNKTYISLPLTQGGYQWRVRGENSAYQSTYSFPVYFEVEETLILTNQQVILTSPSNNYITNNVNVSLNWDDLTAAEFYNLEIVKNSSLIVYQSGDITDTNFTLGNTILDEDAIYTWKVKAINNTNSTETVFSSRTLSIDTVVPNQPQNTLPANNSSQSSASTINFSWTIPADSGPVQSAISFKIEIASDTAFSNILQTSNVNGTTFSQSFSTVGDYYWRITAEDAAGNVGTTSNYFKFTIN